MVLAHNLNTAMKNLILKGFWVTRRMKAIRFHLIHLPERVMERSRQLLIRLAADHPSFEIVVSARQRIMELSLYRQDKIKAGLTVKSHSLMWQRRALSKIRLQRGSVMSG